MSLTIQKGNTPRLTFSFKTESGTIEPIPDDTAKFTLWIHDNASIRQGTGAVSNINTATGTCQYQAQTADTANACVATWWIDVDLGEPVPRTFKPQKVLIEDPTQV